MIKRWRSGRSVTLKALLFSLLSVAAFLEPRPLLNHDADIRNKNNVWKVSHLNAKNKNENNDRSDNEGFFANFFGGSKEKKEEVVAETSTSTGYLKSLSNWREGRKIKAEIERQEKEASTGEDEASEQWSLLPGFFNPTLLFRRSSNEEKERIRNKQRASPDSEETGSKRSNPLSVLQKYVTNVLAQQKSTEEWVAVATKTSIAPGALVPVSAAGLDLLLVASKDGSELHCIANSCPHLGTPLEIGTLERRPIEYQESEPNYGIEKSPNLDQTYIASLLAQDGCEGCIVCPLHKTAFALDSGEVRGVSWSCFCGFRSDVQCIIQCFLLSSFFRNGVHIHQC
jgi:nitrite reductase/ring-hydroxylating ferredoxin subunit